MQCLCLTCHNASPVCLCHLSQHVPHLSQCNVCASPVTTPHLCVCVTCHNVCLTCHNAMFVPHLSQRLTCVFVSPVTTCASPVTTQCLCLTCHNASPVCLCHLSHVPHLSQHNVCAPPVTTHSPSSLRYN